MIHIVVAVLIHTAETRWTIAVTEKGEPMKYEFTLADVVERLVGGDVVPIGDTAYDEKALDRQKAVEDLIDFLMDGVLRCFECRDSYMYSLRVAGDEARTYLLDKLDTLETWLDGERRTDDEIH